jgi:roadblock/LC7 domain-containing protein
MIGLDRLLNIKGVIAAGQFSPDGKVIRSLGNLSKEVMTFTARMCANQTKALETSVEQYSRATQHEWRPLAGWAVWGGKYVVVVMGNTGVFVDSKYADFNQLVIDLMGSEGTGPRQMNY